MEIRWFQLNEEERQQVVAKLSDALAKRKEIVFAVLHGSFAERLPFRDLDIAVWVEPMPDEIWHYEFRLADELTMLVGLPVDVLILNSAPLGFQFHALNGILLMCRDEESYHAIREHTWQLWFDFEPYARENLRALLNPESEV